MKQILAYGDSNTWGLVPGTGERYPEHIRWTGILRKAVAPCGYTVLEDGVCGRTTVFQDPSRSGRRCLFIILYYAFLCKTFFLPLEILPGANFPIDKMGLPPYN